MLADQRLSVQRLLCLNTLLLMAALAMIQMLLSSAPQAAFSRVSASHCRRQDAAIAVLQAENEALLRQRIAYGKLHCKLNGIGPTGGFCVNGTTDVGGNTAWDSPLCLKLSQLFAGKSVLDLGCGLGHYGKCLQAAGTGVRWLGVDGSEGIEEATGGYVKFMDLSMPHQMNESDWVLSLEVAEHLPGQYEQVLLGNIARHAKQGVVLSWAVPGQGGHNHVNNRPNDYVIQKMAQLGFKHDDQQSQALRGVATLPWFKNTVMVFYRA